MDDLQDHLTAQRITIDNLPQDIKRQWVTPNGHARVEVAPEGNTNSTEVLRTFARNGRSIPECYRRPCIDSPIGNTVVRRSSKRARMR